MRRKSKNLRLALLFAIFAILFAPASITIAAILELQDTKFISVVSVGIGFSIFFLITAISFGAYAVIKRLEKNMHPVTNKSFLDVDIKELESCAKNFNRKPITKDKYEILKKTYSILKDKDHAQGTHQNYSEEELKLLTKSGKILFDHLEVEFMISPDDPLKLEKINEALLIGTLEKIKPNIKDENTKKNIATRISDITGQEVDEILSNAPKDKKKFH